MPERQPTIIEIEIDSLAAGGDGVGRVDGKVWFVPFSCPGDRLTVALVKDAKRMSHGRIVELVRGGTGRRDPGCPLFGECGGCSWLHVDETVQCEAKRDILARVVGPDCPVSMHPSPQSLGYRRLARLHVEGDGRGVPKIGFTQARAHGIVDLRRCPVLEPGIEAVIEPIANGPLRHIAGRAEVRLSLGVGGVVMHMQGAAPWSSSLFRDAKALVGSVLAGVVLEGGTKPSMAAGDGFVVEEALDGKALRLPPGGFGQANRGVNALLVETVARLARGTGLRDCAELFCGAGNLTVALSPLFDSVTAVEWDDQGCAAARLNLDDRGASHVKVVCGDALIEYKKHCTGAGLVVLDPPRIGARALAEAMGKGDHRGILYVSCDPATLGRDLGILGRGGYEPVEAVGFDMFPQTSHMEAAVLLSRRTNGS